VGVLDWCFSSTLVELFVTFPESVAYHNTDEFSGFRWGVADSMFVEVLQWLLTEQLFLAAALFVPF
jgi:hypothetical protein